MPSVYSEVDMGLIDDVFAPVPTSVLADWGQTITYIKTYTPRSYDPTTGIVNGSDVTVSVKAVITRLNPRESEGLYQTTDLKVIIGTSELGTYFPTEADRIQYTQDGATREAKIIAITSYRGTNPVLHTLIARPQ
jgi:hypothetical protein